jgi:FSR family fosmidomycin resistance protein-like MFS transporter
MSRPTPPVAAPARSPKPRWSFLKGQVGWLALIALCANLVMLTFSSAVPLWLVSERGLDETSPLIALTLATFSIASAGGGILGGVLVRWLRPRTLIGGSLALSAIALQAIFLTTPGSALYLTAVAAAGGLLYLSGPLLIARAQELSPGAESAIAGVFLGGTSAVAGVAYAGLGAAQAAFGIADTARVLFLVVLPAAHLAAVVLRSREPVKAPSLCPRAAGCCEAMALTS